MYINLRDKSSGVILECHKVLKLTTQLPIPKIIITEAGFGSIIQTFQNLSFIGELRQRWEEIKKLQMKPILTSMK